MSSPHPVSYFLVVFVAGALSRVGLGQTYTVVDRAATFVNPSFSTLANGRTHQQDMVVNHNGWQYLAYWDGDRRLAVARRRLGDARWERLVFEDYRILGNDSHNAVNMGICPNDGTIHLAFDHHSDELNYRVSLPGVATQPESVSWGPWLFGPVIDTLDPARGVVTALTYPRFLKTPTGDLQFVYRQFTSGNGDARLVDYDAATGTWSADRLIIRRNGSHTDPLGGVSNSRNPYFNRIDYDNQGVLHATWTWREAAAIRYNRDIAYAYSEDGGFVWRNSDHNQIADTQAGTSISHASPGVNVVQLGAEWGLLNDQGHVVDSRGRVHVVMYYKDLPATTVSYGNTSNSHFHHHWRDADGVWRSSVLPTIGNRPKLYVSATDDLYLAYVFGGALKIDRATSASDYTDWVTILSYPGPFGSEVQGAVRDLDCGFEMSIALQRSALVQGVPSLLGVGDACFFHPNPLVDAIRGEAHRLPTERDTWVQGGSHALETHGLEPVLRVQNAPVEEDQRLAFARFYLVDLLNKGPVKQATLRLHVESSGSAFATSSIGVRRCALDAWPEATTNWTNRPIPNGPTSLGAGGGAWVDVDVTQIIEEELAVGGGRITFEISGGSAGPSDWVSFHAREAGSLAPILYVEQSNTLFPIADAYVRSGIDGNTNYGGDDRLLVKDDATPDHDRVTFLKFDVSGLRGVSNVERVFLELQSPVRGSDSRTTPYFVHIVADDNWQETSLTWNNQPGLGLPLSAHHGRDSLRWDVTGAALASATGDGVLSLGVRSGREGAGRIIHLWSREVANGSLRPRLQIRYGN